MLLHFIRCPDHGHLCIHIEVDAAVFGGQLEQRFLGLVLFTLADEPPRTFGGDEDERQNDHGPDPLQTEGNPVGPFTLQRCHATENSGCSELTNNPAQIYIGRQVCSQHYRTDIGRVGDGEGLEDTPRNTLQKASGHKRFHILRKEWNESKGNHEKERNIHGLSVAKLVGNDTVDE